MGTGGRKRCQEFPCVIHPDSNACHAIRIDSFLIAMSGPSAPELM